MPALLQRAFAVVVTTGIYDVNVCIYQYSVCRSIDRQYRQKQKSNINTLYKHLYIHLHYYIINVYIHTSARCGEVINTLTGVCEATGLGVVDAIPATLSEWRLAA